MELFPAFICDYVLYMEVNMHLIHATAAAHAFDAHESNNMKMKHTEHDQGGDVGGDGNLGARKIAYSQIDVIANPDLVFV